MRKQTLFPVVNAGKRLSGKCLPARLCYIEDLEVRDVHLGCVTSTKTGLTILELQQPKAFPLHNCPAHSSSNLNFSRLQVHAFLDSLNGIVSL